MFSKLFGSAQSNGSKMPDTQSMLGFSEIRKGIMVMKDNSLRMVIMASPINFDLKSPQERDAIEYAYQGFLNSLNYPIQILIRSRFVNIDNYINELKDKQKVENNPLLSELMADYIDNIYRLLEEVHVMRKEFYVVVPLTNDVVLKSRDKVIGEFREAVSDDQVQEKKSFKGFEDQRKELLLRTNNLAQNLAQIGIRVAILNTQEIIELLYSSYNPGESENQELVNISNIMTSTIQRKTPIQKPKRIPPNRIAPPVKDLYEAARKQK